VCDVQLMLFYVYFKCSDASLKLKLRLADEAMTSSCSCRFKRLIYSV
jgi:hypothetical protein